MKEKGIVYPKGEGPARFDGRTYGETRSEKFPSFEAKIHVPEMGLKGEFPKIRFDQTRLISTYEKTKILKSLKASLMFMTRATELSHFNAPDRMPAWIKNVESEDDFVEPGMRTKWTRLKLFQPEPGKHSVSILKRITEKSDQIAVD